MNRSFISFYFSPFKGFTVVYDRVANFLNKSVESLPIAFDCSCDAFERTCAYLFNFFSMPCLYHFFF